MGLLVVLDHIGRERWFSRGPCRSPVAEIFRWATARAGTIGGPAWTGVSLHALHPYRCVQHWGFVRDTGPAVTAGPVFLGGAHRRLRRRLHRRLRRQRLDIP